MHMLIAHTTALHKVDEVCRHGKVAKLLHYLLYYLSLSGGRRIIVVTYRTIQSAAF
jgi:hypothetical protein